jgi:hypothetical protein
MRVRAIKTGFYGCLREPDGKHAVFDVPDDWKSSWTKPVGQVGVEDPPQDDGVIVDDAITLLSDSKPPPDGVGVEVL